MFEKRGGLTSCGFDRVIGALKPADALAKISSLSITVFFILVFAPAAGAVPSISYNVSETNINSTVLLTGTDFSPSTTYYMTMLLENKSSWWDGYKEQWLFSAITPKLNTTIAVTTNSSGGFSYSLYIPNDWRVSGGRSIIKIGTSLASAMLWSKQGNNWAATQPTKNGITGDSDPAGYVFTASNVSVANQGGVEKFSKVDGSSPCRYTDATVESINDVTNNGSIVYAVTSTATNNLKRINMSDCSLIGSQTSYGYASYSVNVAPNNQFIIITYAASRAPRKFTITADPPVYDATFAPTAVASIAYDSCIAPNSSVVYIGFANGNVSAYQVSNGAQLWTSDPPETTLGAGYNFPVYGLSCDSDRVYVARATVTYPTGVINQGFVEALWASNGSRAWTIGKTDTPYDNGDVNNIRCDNSFCYAVREFPTISAGVAGSVIMQINKTNGNVTWWNWRSWLPTAYNEAYGSGGTHSAAQTLWVDSNATGFLYPVYTKGWVQKIAKADVSAATYSGFWIRGLTNDWNYIADVPKNIWLSNETPYYTFRHWNQQGVPLDTNTTKLVGTLFRYSMLNTFNSFTASEYTASNVLGNSLFIDPVIQTAMTSTQRNVVQMFNGTYHTSCPNTRYAPGLFGWHYQDASCHYEEIPATLAAGKWNIGTTINGTFITGVIYALVKTKFWDYYPITKYYGTDNWAWASWHNTTNNQVLGFATKFGSDQENVYSDNYGRAVLFTNYGTAYYYRPQFRADLNRRNDNYIFFMPKTPDPLNNVGQTTMWRRVDIETMKVGNPVVITLSANAPGSYDISGNTYGNLIPFTAQEPNLLNRTNEPVEIIFNATGAIRSTCQDVIITDTSNVSISLWQVDNSTGCSVNHNVSVWIMMNWTQGESKSLRLYYNSPGAAPVPSGTTDLTVTTLAGSCGGNNHEVNVTSSNWYNWQRPAAATPALELTRFMFNNTANMWASGTTHYQVRTCYKNSDSTPAGAGAAADICASAVPLISRCLQTGGTGKIFAKLRTTATILAITSRPTGGARTLYADYYFFANTGRVMLRTQLNQSLPTITTTVSKNWPPYYYVSINSLIPPQGTNSWLYYSGLYDQMKRPVARFNADRTVANLSAGPLPLLFTIKYGGFSEIPQANGSILRPSDFDTAFWDKGCTAHKLWQYYKYNLSTSLAESYGTATAPLYTSEFISCSKNISSQLPAMGEPGYVNVIPEMAWDETSVNRWYDPSLIGKFYMQPNLYRPDNRENRFLGPYAASNPYSTSARISSYIIPKCPEKEYGYKGYDDFLEDLPNLIADTDIHIRENTENIPCATQVIKFKDMRGSDGIQLIFARNLTVIVGETLSAGWTYPFNTYATGSYILQLNGDLDMSFAQKGSATAGYYGKFYFTYTPNNYVVHAFATSGNPQFMNTPSSTAVSYGFRYAFAPESYYTKHVFDESALWSQKASQNFTYYRNPCWLGTISSSYGSTAAGTLVAARPPGWQHLLWGGGSTYAASTTCPHNTYNLEVQDVFRPGWSSRVPATNDVAAYNELVIDGRENFPGVGTPPGAEDTYYVSMHNSLWDYKHSDDHTSIIESVSDLEEGEKHPNKQPWYCQISRHTNRSFCVLTNALSSLIYTYSPGSLTTSQGWSPYWSSVRETTSFKNYFTLRYGQASGWLFPYDHILDIAVYPTLARQEMLVSNLLYTSGDPDDYETFFQKQSPTAFRSNQQSQFLLKDWENAAFIVFDQDSRQYSAGQEMNITVLVMRNGSILANKNLVVQIFKNDGTHIKTYQASTNVSGMFSWSYTLPSTLTSGLYYVYINYNNGELTDSMSFVVTTYRVVTETDKLSYSQGEIVSITHSITDYISGDEVDPVSVQEEVIDALGTTIKCSRYPSTTPSCTNLLGRSGTGSYYDMVILDESLPSGDATIKVTTTDENDVFAYYYGGFVIGRTAGTITMSLENNIVGTAFTSNVTATNQGYETASKTLEVTVPTTCAYITSLENSTGGSVVYNVEDLSSACKVYWDITLPGKTTEWFILRATLTSSGGAYPSVEVDAPAVVDTNTDFGIVAFVRGVDGQLTNCDANALLTLKNSINGTILLNSVAMTNVATGQYNYTTSLPYQSTFVAIVNCSIGLTPYISNPKTISSQDVPGGGGPGGSAYPTIELIASTPISVSTQASIVALVKSALGVVTNCDGNLDITVLNLMNGSTTNGTMTNFGTGSYKYQWTTPATVSVFHMNANCSISGTVYNGATLLSTQSVTTNTSIDYVLLASYVWGYANRSLTYYNQSVVENLRACLRDSQCTGWWISTALSAINNTLVNQIIPSLQEINQTAHDSYSYLQNTVYPGITEINATTQETLARWGTYNASVLYSRINQTYNSVQDVYTDTQALIARWGSYSATDLYTRINTTYNMTVDIYNDMATAASVAYLQDNVTWLVNNVATTGDISTLIGYLTVIDGNVDTLITRTNCSVPANSVLCAYLDSINASVSDLVDNWGGYTAGDIIARLDQLNDTVNSINSAVGAINSTINNVLLPRLQEINATTQDTRSYVQNTLYPAITEINATTQETLARWGTYNASVLYSRINQTYNSVQDVYTDTQALIARWGSYSATDLYTRINTTYNMTVDIYNDMATAASVAYLQDNVTWLVNNVATTGDISTLIGYLTVIDGNVDTLITRTNCSVPANSVLCAYLDSINASVSDLVDNWGGYTAGDIIVRLNQINQTSLNIYDYLQTTIYSMLNSTTNDTQDILNLIGLPTDGETAPTLFGEHAYTQNRLVEINNNITDLRSLINGLNVSANLNVINATVNSILTNVDDLEEMHQCTYSPNTTLCTFLGLIRSDTQRIYTLSLAINSTVAITNGTMADINTTLAILNTTLMTINQTVSNVSTVIAQQNQTLGNIQNTTQAIEVKVDQILLKLDELEAKIDVLLAGSGGGGGGGHDTWDDDEKDEAISILRELKSVISADLLSILESILAEEQQQSASQKDTINLLLAAKALIELDTEILKKSPYGILAESWYSYGSVKLNVVLYNPFSVERTAVWKQNLPAEVQLSDIISTDGLQVGYDIESSSIYVYLNTTLGSHTSIMRSVEIADIWAIPEEELNAYVSGAEEVFKLLGNTPYNAQALTLKTDIVVRVNSILSRVRNVLTPEQHIETYRAAKIELEAVKEEFNELQKLLSSNGAEAGLGQGIATSSLLTIFGSLAILIVLGLVAYMLLHHHRHPKTHYVVLDKDAVFSNGKMQQVTVIPPSDVRTKAPAPPGPHPAEASPDGAKTHVKKRYHESPEVRETADFLRSMGAGHDAEHILMRNPRPQHGSDSAFGGGDIDSTEQNT